jgi:aminoglycoside 6-adenylyltransferase
VTPAEPRGADRILGKVVTWATREANVRRLLLVGSRARTAPPDDLADIDVQVYARTHEPYTRDDAWLSGIGRTWVWVPDEYSDGDIAVPTRLVIFDGGVKVDFAFYPAGAVSSGVGAGLPHRVLVEKDGSDRGPAAGAQSPRGFDRPSEAEFARVVREFWFEEYHVAKYLARNELWLAKARDWATKELLLKMIGWHERIVRGRGHEMADAGRRVGMSEDVWAELDRTFARFEREEAWEAAAATMRLFRRLATETAAALGFSYAVDLDGGVSGFILGLRAATRSRGA